MRSNTRWLSAAAGVLAALGGLTAAPPAATSQEVWNGYTYNAVATLTAVRGLQQISDTMERETNGALKIRIHLGGSLQIQATNITAAVSDNVVQFADDSLILGSIPIAGVLRLPMLIRDNEEYAKAAAVINPYIEAAYAKKGVVVLADYVYPVQILWSRKKLVQLSDVNGQKIRTTSPEQGEFIKRFGGIPVPIGTPEVPTAIDRGVIDGVLTASAGAGYIWRDLLKYRYALGLNYNNSFIVVNKGTFEKLSPDVQAKLRAAAKEGAAWIQRSLMAEEEDLTKKMVDAGLVATAARPEEVAEAERKLASYWDEWAKTRGGDAAQAVVKLRAALGR